MRRAYAAVLATDIPDMGEDNDGYVDNMTRSCSGGPLLSDGRAALAI